METRISRKKYYKAIKVNGKKQDYHRYLVEQKAGRKLRSNEVTHHKDENKLNNNPDNLEVLSRSKHSRFHSRKTLNGAKLTPDDVRTIRGLIKQGMRVIIIAQRYGVDRKAISCIKHRHTWGWLN